jgi:acyl-coenzyme A thioesterase 13
MKSLEMTAAFKHSPTHTQVTFRFPVQREYLNPGGTLHGAAQSLFFDVCTTWLLAPIARKPDYWCSFGTSRNLNVTYLRPAREGDMLTLECEVSYILFSSCSVECLERSYWLFCRWLTKDFS